MGTTQVDPPASVPGYKSGEIRVYRLNETTLNDGTKEKSYELLPWVRLVSDARRAGSNPGSAQLRYVFDDLSRTAFGWPNRVHQVTGLQAGGAYKVKLDDRLVAFWESDSGDYHCLFDGYIVHRQADLGDRTERASIPAAAWPTREWDDVLGGQFLRDMVDPWHEGDRQTDLPARFNADGQPNCINTDACELVGHEGDFPYPSFADPLCRKVDSSDRPATAFWTLAGAAKYILREGNPDQEFTQYAKLWKRIDDLFSDKVPKEGKTFDASDPTTYDVRPILAFDVEITGMAWPVAFEQLIQAHGFTFAWRLYLDAEGFPYWDIDVYRKHRDSPPRELLMQASGPLDPSKTNVATSRVAYDFTEVVNDFYVHTDQVYYEIGVLLSPLFRIDVADAADPSKFDLDRVSPADADKYRLFGADETGDGHWSFATNAWVESLPIDLRDLLNPEYPAGPAAAGRPPDPTKDPVRYAQRRRVPFKDLLSRKATDIVAEAARRNEAALWVVTNYTKGPVPGLRVKDDAAIAQLVHNGGWELLRDRLGVRLTGGKANGWAIGPYNGAANGDKYPYAGGIVPVVEALASPTASSPLFALMLCCVVKGDKDLLGAIGKSDATPLPWTIRRADDTRSRFRKEVVHASSPFNATGKSVTIRDDTAKASDHGRTRRASTEVPKLGGSFSISRLTFAYAIGDRLSVIRGRNLSLRLDRPPSSGAKLGDPTGRYPVVVGIDRNYEGGFATSLVIDDLRAEVDSMLPIAVRSKGRPARMQEYVG